jgi:hypothetical protein
MTGTIEIEYTTATNNRHRVVYEHDVDGDWTRTEYRRMGCEWRLLGSETVSGLRVDDDRPQTRAFRGPE